MLFKNVSLLGDLKCDLKLTRVYRRRRIKCDERKPVCRRCSSTGRVCDGYGIWGDGGNQYGTRVQTLPQVLARHNTPSPLWCATEEERLSFDFFRTKTATAFPSAFESQFWDQFVLQASVSEPAVLHAATALGAAHMARYTRITGTQSKNCVLLFEAIDLHDSVALKQYNTSISRLQVHLSRIDEESLDTVLVTCMLLICLELVRGEQAAAITHLSNGLKLLCQGQHTPVCGGQSSKNAIEAPQARLPDYALTEAFSRLNIQSSMFGRSTQPLYFLAQIPSPGLLPIIPSSFGTAYEARRYLDRILNGTYCLMDHLRSTNAFALTCSDSVIASHRSLWSAASSWKRAYDCSLDVLFDSANHRTAYGIHILRMYHTLIIIILSVALSHSREMDFDAYTEEFCSIVTQATTLCGMTGYGVSKSNFNAIGMRLSLDMGIIAPLYYTALKCRVPWLRRQAVAVLAATPYKEGLWDSGTAAHVAGLIINLEEGDMFTDVNFDGEFFGAEGGEEFNIPLVPEN